MLGIKLRRTNWMQTTMIKLHLTQQTRKRKMSGNPHVAACNNSCRRRSSSSSSRLFVFILTRLIVRAKKTEQSTVQMSLKFLPGLQFWGVLDDGLKSQY